MNWLIISVIMSHDCEHYASYGMFLFLDSLKFALKFQLVITGTVARIVFLLSVLQQVMRIACSKTVIRLVGCYAYKS